MSSVLLIMLCFHLSYYNSDVFSNKAFVKIIFNGWSSMFGLKSGSKLLRSHLSLQLWEVCVPRLPCDRRGGQG